MEHSVKMGCAQSLPSTPSFRLEGKKALVTGASSGIGLGCAVALAEAGAHLVIAARGAERLQTVETTMIEAGFNVYSAILDVSDTEAVRTLFAAHGPFDIVVNSAGIAHNGPSLDVEPQTYRTVFDTNTLGSFFVAQTAAQSMIAAQRSGSIIFISSQMGLVGGIDRAVYCGSKHALEGFQKAMAIEWGVYGIRINSICPTFIRTPLTAPTFANPERLAWIKEKIKLGRVGEVEDIMGAVLFLACDASSLVTGSSVVIDGGWTAG